MKRAILFDLDGTLTDPKPGITGSILYAMHERGYASPNADDLHWCIGPPLTKVFERLLKSSDCVLLNEAIASYRERFSIVGLFENTLYPQIPDALQKLRSSGYRTFVATSKPRVYAVRIIEHFSLVNLFDEIYGSELDGTRGNKSELIAHILASEELSPVQTVMVGDREHDVIGAKKCGVPCIGVTYGYGTASELISNGAKLVANSPQEIPGLVEMHFNSA